MKGFLGHGLELRMFIEFKQLFEPITAGRRTTEKRFDTDTNLAYNSHTDFGAHHIGLVGKVDIPVDELGNPWGSNGRKQAMGGTEITEVVEWTMSRVPQKFKKMEYERTHWKRIQLSTVAYHIERRICFGNMVNEVTVSILRHRFTWQRVCASCRLAYSTSIRPRQQDSR